MFPSVDVPVISLSDSDSDDDFEDPDFVQVPGCGKALGYLNFFGNENEAESGTSLVSNPLSSMEWSKIKSDKFISNGNLNFHSMDMASHPSSSKSTKTGWDTFKTLIPASHPDSQPEDDMHLGDDEDDGLGITETFSEYSPAKLNYGERHPDPVVETASLSTVSVPDIRTKLHLPGHMISSGALSALQLEAVIYACQQHDTFLPSGERAGYLVGDGAGVGKGRTVAGIIYENFLCGRKKALWISISPDLKQDCERDLDDIGAKGIKVIPLNKLKYGRITDVKQGVIFSTYASLIGESTHQGGEFNSRMKQLLDWCTQDFDGVIIFDECHRAKNLCPAGSTKSTKTGKAVFDLQNSLKSARIVYASATGASEPKNMAYMTRLGIWGRSTPFQNFESFIKSIEKRGIGAMELIAMDMKQRGAYIARQLSFHGVKFSVEEVPLTPEFIDMYNESVKLWVLVLEKLSEAIEVMDISPKVKKSTWAQFWSAHQRFFKYLCIAAKVSHAVKIAMQAIKDGKCVVIGLQSTGEARAMDQFEKDDGELFDFISTAKGVIQTLVEKHFPGTSDKSLSLIQDIRAMTKKTKKRGRKSQKSPKRIRIFDDNFEDLEDEKSSDSCDSEEEEEYDAVTSDSESDLTDCPSSRSCSSDDEGMMSIRRGRRRMRKRKRVNKLRRPSIPHRPIVDTCRRIYKTKLELLNKIEQLGNVLPPNSLDQLIDELGGPDEVAEMTGRKRRVIQKENGQIEYASRSESDVSLEIINLKEKARFMNGEKYIAIISEAASSGISLQSDRRVKNIRRRVHITLELPWSADRAIQQFGRTHRSNQVSAPEYVLLISDLAGERRFASVVAKRLESLGALTHGDRRAAESRDLSRFHVDNKYGRLALENVMNYIIGLHAPIVKPPNDYYGNFCLDMSRSLEKVGLIASFGEVGISLEQDSKKMSKFLNRILGMPVRQQNALFQFFVDTLNALIMDAKKTGHFEMGIMDLVEKGDSKCSKIARYKMSHSTGSGYLDLIRVTVDRGLSWSHAFDVFNGLTGLAEGFYLCKQIRNGRQLAMLAVADKTCVASTEKNTSHASFTLYRPNTGAQIRRETLYELTKKYDKVDPEEAREHWVFQYESSGVNCVHAFWSGKCRQRLAGYECDTGSRTRTYHVLTGAVMRAWTYLEDILHSTGKLQIVRVTDEIGKKMVGVMIPNSMVCSLQNKLRSFEL